MTVRESACVGQVARGCRCNAPRIRHRRDRLG